MFEIVLAKLNHAGEEVGRRYFSTDEPSKLAAWYYRNRNLSIKKGKIVKKAEVNNVEEVQP